MINLLKKIILKLLLPFPAGVLVAVLLWLASSANFLNITDKSRSFTLDLLNESFPYEQMFDSYSDQMVFIDIDDEALNKVGQWPWPRQKIAEIFKMINQQQPTVIGVDILFAEKDRYAADNMSTFFEIERENFLELGILNGDELLAQIMDNHPYVLALSLIHISEPTRPY